MSEVNEVPLEEAKKITLAVMDIIKEFGQIHTEDILNILVRAGFDRGHVEFMMKHLEQTFER